MVTNPPYQGSRADQADAATPVAVRILEGKQNLYSAFMVRAVSLAERRALRDGDAAELDVLSDHFEPLRALVLEAGISSTRPARLEAAFEEITGEVVSVLAFTIGLRPARTSDRSTGIG